MKRYAFFLFIALWVSLPILAAAESQTWKLRPGDTIDTVAATLEIPRDEIKNRNPGLSETNLRIGQKLNLPLRPYAESKALEDELRRKSERLGTLESDNAALEKQIASAESRLRWYPLWLWGFWICFSIIAFIAAGAYWIFRQTHPRVFDEPHERSLRDLRQSQLKLRSSLPDEEELGRQWEPSLKRFPHAR